MHPVISSQIQCLSVTACLASALQDVMVVSICTEGPRLEIMINQKGDDRIWGRQIVEHRKFQVMQNSQEVDTSAESRVQVEW